MLRKIIYALLLCPVLFAACNKKDDTPANTFIINGVHDVAFTAQGLNYLELAIVHVSGVQERVVLTVAGLPAGVTAHIETASGTPDFSTIIVFSLDANAAEGSYPIRIIGAAPSYTKSYDLNLVVPPFNGFTVNGAKYRVGQLERNWDDIFLGSNDHNGASLICTPSAPLPVLDGLYTYQLEETPSSDNSMQLVYFELSTGYFPKGASGNAATISVTGGKIFLSVPKVTLYSVTGDQKELSVSARQ